MALLALVKALLAKGGPAAAALVAAIAPSPSAAEVADPTKTARGSS